MSGNTSDRLTAGRNLVLIGGRASGKTSVGQALAKILGRPFVDLDEVLTAEAGCAIADLVAREGWPEFRRREKALVARYGRRSGQVLAPGGGVVLDPENVAILREQGLIVWLKADAATLARRLRNDEGGFASRPSLTGADPAAEMARVLAEREPLYEAAAHVVLDTADLSIPEVIERLLHLIGATPEQ
ncbi:MAG: shikimate kinase [Desulfobaccales bacterium]